MKKIYNKLVRDKIPALIKEAGKECKTKYLDSTTYQAELKNKLCEEALEVKKADTKEELIKEIADVLEVIDAIKKSYELSESQIQYVKESKNNANGAFQDQIYLEYVIEKDDE
jgi:predicted house-cleaning noncanonical NTP pyrophosphatase (MazG superfamily)